jgi:hypothetical protein
MKDIDKKTFNDLNEKNIKLMQKEKISNFLD